MKNIKEYIESGILEMYVLALTSEEENKEIEALSLIYSEIRNEIEEISESVMKLSLAGVPGNVKLNSSVKPFVMAVIYYTERLKNGEEPEIPPVLSENTNAGDFTKWLNRQDMIFDGSFGDTYARIIGYTPQIMTAIVWLKHGAAQEVHDKEYEKFLILEGSCDIVTNDDVFSLSAGNYFQIPLHISHRVEVTSEIPYKLILQRMAA